MPVDIWQFESELYPAIDSHGARDKTAIRRKFHLGEGQYVEVRITSKKHRPLSNKMIVYSDDIDFGANFWKDKKEWLRIDNHRGFLHLHLDKDGVSIKKHQTVEEGMPLSELISSSFELCRRFLKEKYPNSQILDSDGFGGFA